MFGTIAVHSVLLCLLCVIPRHLSDDFTWYFHSFLHLLTTSGLSQSISPFTRFASSTPTHRVTPTQIVAINILFIVGGSAFKMSINNTHRIILPQRERGMWCDVPRVHFTYNTRHTYIIYWRIEAKWTVPGWAASHECEKKATQHGTHAHTQIGSTSIRFENMNTKRLEGKICVVVVVVIAVDVQNIYIIYKCSN